jgi:uncharacterized protein involved in exopolysaccharide biosynthesis
MNDFTHPNSAGTESSSMTLRDLVTPLFRRRRLFTFSFLGLALLAVLAALHFSNTYKCTMEILVNQERLDPSVSSEATSLTPVVPLPLTEEEINSEAELLLSPDLLTKVALANGLQEREKRGIAASILPRQQDDWYIAKAVKHLGQALDNIAVVRKTNMIQVDYKSSDPKVAFGVLDTLAGLYMEKHLTVHRPTGSYDFFAKETARYKQALADSEMRLADFGKTEGVVAPDVERFDLAQVVANSVGTFHQAQQAIASDEQRIRYQEAKMKEIPSRSSTQETSNAANLLLQQLEASLLAARVNRSQLAIKYDPSYPLVQEADREIAGTEAAIADAQKTQYVNQTTDRDPTYELLREDLAKTQADLASQKAAATALQRSIGSIQQEMVSLDQKAVKQAGLLREAKADEGNYLLYLAKREQERTSDALDQKRIGNVSIAEPPIMPILPQYGFLPVLVIGCFVALFLSACGVFVMEYFDPSLRTPTEVSETLRIPVLACVPRQVA